MKFICLRYQDRNLWGALDEGGRRALRRDCESFDASLQASGHLAPCARISCSGEAIGLSRYQGQLMVRDESGTTAHDFLEGLMFLEARDLNHAILLISDHPGINFGWFMIHPTIEEGRSQ